MIKDFARHTHKDGQENSCDSTPLNSSSAPTRPWLFSAPPRLRGGFAFLRASVPGLGEPVVGSYVVSVVGVFRSALMIVMKFGGTSVQDAQAIDRVAAIVRDRLP